MTTLVAMMLAANRWMGALPRDQFDMLLLLTKDQHSKGHRAGQAHIAARLRERADAASGSAQAVMYEIVRMIEACQTKIDVQDSYPNKGTDNAAQ